MMTVMAETLENHLPIPHPEWLARIDRIAALREGIVLLLEEESRLLLREQPVLIAEYEARLGALDLELLTLEAECAELRFRFERLNIHVNRGEAITPERLRQLEHLVIEERAIWAARLAERQADLALGLATFRHFTLVDTDVTRRCTTAYRRLVRLLHPDVTRDPETSRRYWQTVQDAYRVWDVERLESLLLLIGGTPESRIEPVSGFDGLDREIARLEAQSRALALRRDSLLARSPFCHRDLLRDPERIAALRVERLAAIEAVRARRDHLRALLQAILERETETLH